MTAADEGSVPAKGSRVQVVVRVRPVLTLDSADQLAVTCSPDGSKIQVLLPEKGTDKQGPPGAVRAGARAYEFDACLPGSTTQAELFEICGMSELVEAALDGYSVTVFAFGQTGSGKTHTMIGPRLSRPGETASTGVEASIPVDEEDGVLARCITYAYSCIAERAAQSKFNVSASCVELYNESVTDLLGLDKNKTLHVRKDARDGFQVEGLTQLSCPSAASASRYIQRAMIHRHTRSHKLNEYSSRSHCLTTFVFASQELLQAGQGDGDEGGPSRGVRRYGKLCLVDLAGSERLKSTGNTEREAVRETGAINKSLFTLGQVLNALSSRSAAPAFVPYRDSKLTQLLWDGLKGSGRALMLACLGPLRNQSEESLNTLHFASMARRIKAAPVVLLDPQDALVLQLRKTILDLRKENQQLAVALTQLSTASENGDSSSSSRALQLLQLLPEGLREDAMREAAAEREAASHRHLSTSQDKLRISKFGGGTFAESPEDSPLAARKGSPVPSKSRAGTFPTNLSPTRQSSQMQPQASAKSGSGYSPLAAAAAAAGSLNYSYDFASILSPDNRNKAAGSSGADNRRRSSSIVPGDMFRARSNSSTLLPSVNGALQPSKSGKANGTSNSNSNHSSNHNSVNSASRQARASSSADRASPLPPPPLVLTIPVMTSAGGSSGALHAPSPVADSFPELAAMEADFLQVQLAIKPSDLSSRRQSRSAISPVPQLSSLSGASKVAVVQESAASKVAVVQESGARVSDGLSDDAGEPVAADVRALKWASKNTWFGSDVDMTTLAYEAHDRLVDVEHLDPSSEEYYTQIEKQVAAAFPAKWNAFLHHHATRTARRPSVQLSPPSKGRRSSFRFNDGNNGPNMRIGSPPKNRKPFVGMINTVVGGSAMSVAAATAIAAGRIFGNINVNGAVGAARQPPLSPHRGNLTAQRQGRRDATGAQPTFASSSLHSPYSLTNTGNSPPSSNVRPIANLHLHKQHPVPVGVGTLSPRSAHHSNASQPTPVLTNRSAATYPSVTSTPATSSPNTPAHPHATSIATQPLQRQSSANSTASNASFAHPVNPFNLAPDAPDSDRYPSHTTITAEADDSGGMAEDGGAGQDAVGAAAFQAVWNNGDYFAGSAGQTLVGGIRGEGFGVSGLENGGADMISAQAMQVEYVRQRGIVLQELRQAKAEAEEERRKILARIGSSLVDGAWR